MKNNKKKTIVRILIFLIIAFVPAILFSRKVFSGESSLLALLITMSPAIANIITRLVTREGFANSLLYSSFKGNFRFYLDGLIFALLNGIIAAVLIVLFYVPNYSFKNDMSNDFAAAAAVILLSAATAVAAFFLCMGEEFGWRGYLTPKLEEIMGTPAALIVSGIIWGLWHAPMIKEGLNFGTDYKFFPWAGIGVMCLSCILYGSFLTYLTKRTGSIYPASICHTAVDLLNNRIIAVMLGKNVILLNEHAFGTGVLAAAAPLIVGIISFIVIVRRYSVKIK